MSSTICILPDHLINQIAAGEVIEDPSSVIKELVENALDAKATSIVISIQAAGMFRIAVEDDGIGMSLDDMQLALKRHATSKIYTMEDLLNVQTMGFRGEALASIAAVAKVKIESAKDNKTAAVITIEKGKMVSSSYSCRTKGTTVEVKSLFYNVPVRKKFQKSRAACVSKIHRAIIHIALAYPHIGFSFFSDEKKILETKPYDNRSFMQALENTIIEILGREYLSEMTLVDFVDHPIQMLGFLASPIAARKTRKDQYVFVNNRPVFSSLIAKAISEGYGTRIREGYHSSYIMHYKIPSAFIDVNVHPQKKEIRLREENFIKEKIIKAISSAFQIKNVTLETPSFSVSPTSFSVDQENQSLKETILPPSTEHTFQQKDFFIPEDRASYFFPINVLAMAGIFAFVDAASISFLSQEEKQVAFVIIDMQAAYSCCLFDTIIKSQTEKKSIERQLLHLPVLVDIAIDQRNIVEKYSAAFHKMGWELRFVSDRTIAIDTLPTFMKEEEVAAVFMQILEDLTSCGETNVIETQIQKKLARSICRFVKSQKKFFTKEETQIILEKLLQCKEPTIDPLGFPTYLVLSEDKIQKLFTKRGKI